MRYSPRAHVQSSLRITTLMSRLITWLLSLKRDQRRLGRTVRAMGVLGLVISVGELAVTRLSAQGFSASGENGGWLSDRTYTEGRGIRLGNLELHPGVGAEVGYDSNFFYADEAPADTFLLRVTPHLALSTLSGERLRGGAKRGSPPTVNFRAGLAAGYHHFFIDNTRNALSANAGAQLTLLPERPFGLRLRNEFERTIRPFAQNNTSANVNYARNSNEAGADLLFASRSQVLSSSIGYTFGLDYFEGAFFDYNNSIRHSILANATWRFLPSTALLYEGGVTYTDYTNPNQSPLALLSDNTIVSSLVGLNGIVTTRFSLTAMIGYSAGFYEVRDEFDGVIGRLEGRWNFRRNMSLLGGYSRDYSRSFLGNSMRTDRLYASAEGTFGGVFLMRLRLGADYIDFGTPLGPNGNLLGNQADRQDWRLLASLFGEYRLSNMIGLNATLQYSGDYTDYAFVGDAAGQPFLDPAGWTKFEAYAGARVFY